MPRLDEGEFQRRRVARTPVVRVDSYDGQLLY